MEMSGERIIAADRATVWAALNDPEVLKACIPGCTELEKTSDTGFTATVVQKVGPVKATFTGEVELSDIVEGESYTISGKGKGGAAGAASGGAKVRLEDVPEGTKLTYEAEAKVTGKIAQLGARLINGFAKKMADDFFTRFQEEVEGASGSGGDGDAPLEGEVDPEDGPRDGKSEDHFSDRISHTVDEAVEAIGEFADKAEHTAKDLAGKAGKVAGEVADKAETATRKAAHNIASRIEKAEPEKKGFWKRLFGG